jgi:hypothetical protein
VLLDEHGAAFFEQRLAHLVRNRQDHSLVRALHG